MAKVLLNFLPPIEENIVALRIHESAEMTGPFMEFERVTAIGTYPSYLTRYTTSLATRADDWFAIQWEDSNGIVSDLSAPIQGGTTSLVQILNDRMLLRDPSLDENIAAQEAEAAISSYYGTVDPYGIDPTTVSPAILSGLTLLSLARSYLFTAVSAATSNVQKFTAGLVTLDKGSSSTSSSKGITDLEAIIKVANGMLGKNFSIIGMIQEIEVADGVKQIVGADLSRLIIEVA